MRHIVTGVASVGHFDNFCCWQFGDDSSAHKDGINIMLEEIGKHLISRNVLIISIIANLSNISINCVYLNVYFFNPLQVFCLQNTQMEDVSKFQFSEDIKIHEGMLLRIHCHY